MSSVAEQVPAPRAIPLLHAPAAPPMQPAVASFPDGYTGPCPVEERQEVLEWLSKCGSFASLGLLLRMDAGPARELARLGPGDYNFDATLAESVGKPLRRVADGWYEVLEANTVWRDVLKYPAVHACAIRGPADKLKQFVDGPLLQSPDSPVCGIVVSERAYTPGAQARRYREQAFAAVTQTLRDRLCTSDRDEFGHGPLTELCRALLGDKPIADDLLAADTIKWLVRSVQEGDGEPREGEDERIRDWLNQEPPYIDGLGIGQITRWPKAGAGRQLMIVDSGSDESHPMLRRRVLDYQRFDFAGQAKKAHDAVDTSCHGTKIVGLICGNEVMLCDLGFPGSKRIRLSLAPAAQAGVAEAMSGGFKGETGTLVQFLGALEWVSQNALRGYDVVNISMESARPLSPGTRRAIRLTLNLLRHRGVVPILASGNCGAQSNPLAAGDISAEDTVGCYVGAADRNGVADVRNGPCHFLAPGVDLIVARPTGTCDHGRLVGLASGSSLAAAVASGCLALASSATGKPARELIPVFKDTFRGRMINMDEVWDLLKPA